MSDYRPTKKQTRQFFYDALCKMYGEKCYICKKSPPEVKLIVEHRNGTKADYSFDNIYLGCRSCNRKKSPDLCQESAADSGKSVCVTEKAAESTTDSEKYRERSRIKKASVEIEINRDSEPMVRRYLWENVGRPNGLTVEDAVNESAEKADCSPVTSRRHIMKACSLAGPFKIEEDVSDKKDYIYLRADYNANILSRLGKLDAQIIREQAEQAEQRAIRAEETLQNTNRAIRVVENNRDFYLRILKDVASGKIAPDQLQKEMANIENRWNIRTTPQCSGIGAIVSSKAAEGGA